MRQTKYKACLLLGFILCFSFARAQNQALADSLINVYEHFETDDSVKLEALRNISFHHPNQDEKIFYANKLIHLARRKNDKLYEFRGLFQKGNALRNKGELEQAGEVFFQAIEIATDINYALGVGSVYLALADVYSINENYKNSTYYYNKSIGIFKELGDSVNLATALMNAGDDYYHAHQLDSALMYFNESLDIFKVMDYDIGIAYNQGNVGLVYAKQGYYRQAEENLSKASEILTALGDIYPVTVYQLSMAEIFQGKNDFKRALEYAHLSLALAKQEGLKVQVRDASLKLSELYAQTEDYERAYHHHSQYVAYRDSISNEETIRKMADLRTEYEVSQKQAEIDLLNQKRERNYILGLALLIFTLMLTVLAIVLYRNNRIKRSANKLLLMQNNKLELQHNKLAALNNTKDRFFSIISHDLRGPVNAFNGISELIKHYIARNEMGQLQEVSVYIDKSARQLSSLLDNLLDWSVKQQGTFPFRPEMLYLNPLLREVTDMFRMAAHAKNITLNLEVDEKINVWADRNSLMTVIRNLLNNALKFTQTDGLVSLSAYTENGYVHINVIDTGVGIPEEKLESLFLLQDKVIGLGTAGEKGLGIGLSLAHEFTQMNNGALIANSEVGAGSIFTVKIPLTASRKTKKAHASATEEKHH